MKELRIKNFIIITILASSTLLATCNLESKIFGLISGPSTLSSKTYGLGGTDTHITTSNSEIIVRVRSMQDAEPLANVLGAEILHTLSIGNAHFIKITGGNTSLEIIKSYTQVLDAEYEQYRSLHTSPNDTYYDTQYSPQLTELESVWDTYTGNGVKVAVIDSGVDTTHEDFGGASTFVDGYDYNDGTVYTTTENTDNNRHGTHVAGIIAARKNNAKGISGVAPEATIIPYKGSNNKGIFSSLNIASAIKTAVDAGADVINMSLGGPYTTSAEAESVKYAIENNVVVVVSTGNDSIELLNYPASLPGVIAVGSSNGRDEISSYSTRSSVISVVAPGEDIVSLNSSLISTSDKYISLSGTSMAAPFVSGLVALIKEKFPTATPAQVKKLLENTAKDLGPTGYDRQSGFGRVRPKEALAETNLPSVSWQKVEFTIRLAGVNHEGYNIKLRDNSDAHLYTLFTGADGKASAYLPSGTYKYASNYAGVEYSGNLTVTSTTLSLSRDFQENEFDGYYRVSTYKDSTSADTVDTLLALFKRVGTDWVQIALNEDRNSDAYSELVFKPELGVWYLIYVQAGYSTEANSGGISGDYILKVESDILSAETRGGTGIAPPAFNTSLSVDTGYKDSIVDRTTQNQYLILPN